MSSPNPFQYGTQEWFNAQNAARVREFNEGMARHKDASERESLLFACHQLFARNVGTSTFFGNYDYNIDAMAVLLADYLEPLRRI